MFRAAIIDNYYAEFYVGIKTILLKKVNYNIKKKRILLHTIGLEFTSKKKMNIIWKITLNLTYLQIRRIKM